MVVWISSVSKLAEKKQLEKPYFKLFEISHFPL